MAVGTAMIWPRWEMPRSWPALTIMAALCIWVRSRPATGVTALAAVAWAAGGTAWGAGGAGAAGAGAPGWLWVNAGPLVPMAAARPRAAVRRAVVVFRWARTKCWTCARR